jgi:fibronectin type 3 domain-containing protein
MIKLINTVLFFIIPLSMMAQISSQRVLVRNAGIAGSKHVISIKWYTNDLYYPEGINIYRKEDQKDWVKLNINPVRKLDSLPESEFSKDPDLDFFVPLINESRKEDIKGLFLINILVKSFQSEVFSHFLGIQYEDSTVKAGESYSYKISRIKGAVEMTIGESVLIQAGTESFEEAVRDVWAKSDTQKVRLRWKVEERRFYAVNIYRNGPEKIWKLINKNPVIVSKTKDRLGHLQYPSVFFIDDSLKPGTYHYQLSGIDFFGKESKRSESVRVDVKDLIPPPPPENLKDSINNLNVILTWTDPRSDDIVFFNIYRSIKSTGPFVKLNPEPLPANTSAYKDIVPHPGPYYYYISSVDLANNESACDPVFTEVHDIVPPTQPLGLSAKADTGKINLHWQKNKEADLAGYLIYRTINRNERNNFILLNSDPVKEPNFTDILPRNARNRFLYKIIAIDSSFNKSQASEVISAVMPDVIPPVKPYMKSLTNGENYILIKWLPNKDEDLKGYNIYRSDDHGGFSQINKTLIVSSRDNFANAGIESGKEYLYYLTAVDSTGNESQPSNILKGFNHLSSFQSGPTNLKVTYREKKKEVFLSWKHESPQSVIGFVIYRKENGSDQMIPVSGQTESNEFYDSKIKSGNIYHYQIRAYDKAGKSIKSETVKISIK